MTTTTTEPQPTDTGTETDSGTDTATGTAGPAQPASDRVRVRRLANRGRYDRETVHAILAEGIVAHAAVTTPEGPITLPMVYGRIDDDLYLHGAVGNALLRGTKDVELGVTVTLVDGLVLARSAFHHSMNYRCVVVRGRARVVTDAGEKAAALDAIVDHALPGRSREARPANASELRTTLVLAIPLEESSAKIRTGPPIDDEDDMAIDVWAGVIPLTLERGTPIPD